MALIVVSDLHIRGPEDPLYASLLKLLTQRAQPGDVVVLAGDVFDLFVGSKPFFISRYEGFLRALRVASDRGVKVHYIEGNHDFHVRRAFAPAGGVDVHPESLAMEIGGKRFLVVHGDTVNKRDYGYKALRFFFRSPVMRALVALAPGKTLHWIGESLSSKSRARKPELPAHLPVPRMENLRKLYRNFAAEKLSEGYDFVVAGHCHDLDEMEFNIAGRRGQYINVGYPRAHESFLCWSPGDSKIQRERLPS